MGVKKKVIFLVDDDVTNLTIGKGVLSGVYSVFTLNSGANMLNMLNNVRPDLILLDVNMPGMDGYEALTALKANPNTAGIPVIFLTAVGGVDKKDVQQKGLDLGALEYITKPFLPETLLNRLEVHLRGEGGQK